MNLILLLNAYGLKYIVRTGESTTCDFDTDACELG